MGASDYTRTQFADVAEQMYVKIGGVQAYGGYSNPKITVGKCFFPINSLSKKKSAMSFKIRKPCKLKVRYYTENMI